MAEDSELEKTEQPSPRKLEKAREDGDVPRSRELASFALLMAAAGGFWLSGASMVAQLQQTLRTSLDFQLATVLDSEQLAAQIGEQLVDLLRIYAPFLGLLLLAALGAPGLIGGWLFNSQALLPNFGRLNPLHGLGNLFSKNTLVELLKAICKVGLIGLLAWFFLRSELSTLLILGDETLPQALSHQGQLLLRGFSLLVAGLAVIALIDAPYQRYRYTEKLMMTRQELRDEAKETEGNPEIKAKLRAQQREMARRRMMSQVPTADVVVTNPTHYAVALKYPEHSNQAPLVIAKGVDHTAAKIRALAAEHHIVMMEAPALARALYQHTELDDEIPASLYTAVAQVLAYVFQLRNWQQHGGEQPLLPELVTIPAGLDPLASAGQSS